MAATFSYNPNLAANRDFLRYLIGDTEPAYRLFWDQELNAVISLFGDDLYLAAGWCLRILAHDPDRLMRTKDATAGGFSLLALMRLYAARSDTWLA